MAALLIPIVLKSTVVLLSAWGLTRVMLRASAAARHLTWSLAVVVILALPVVQWMTPAWDVAVLPAEVGSDPLNAAAQPLDTPRIGGQTPRVEATQPLDTLREGGLTPLGSEPAWAPVDWGRMLIFVWLGVAALALVRLAAGLALAAWMVRRAEEVTDDDWLQPLDEIAATLGISRHVTLKVDARTSIPVACGIRTPTVLLPRGAEAWPAERRRVVLLHELAHIARRDCLVQLLGQCARALYWFNPLVHLAVARLRAEQERACDDLVLAAGTDGPAYADHLFEIARGYMSEGAPAWAALAMARPSQLEGRVMAILDDRRNRRPPARWVRAAVGATAGALLLPIGALQLTAAAGPDPSPSIVAVAQADPAVVPAPARAAVPAAAPDPVPLVARAGVDVLVHAAMQAVEALQAPSFDFDFDFDFGPPAQNPDPRPGQTGDTTVTDDTRRRVADALVTALDDNSPDVREQALSALANMRDERAIPGLLKALADPEADVRERALNALAQFRTPEAIQGILGALKDADPEVREHAARHVGALASRDLLDDAQYVDVMLGLLRDSNTDVKIQAINALGSARRREAVAPLLPLLQDGDIDVRERTARALGNIADPAAIDALTAALKDSEPEVREQAARALGQIARGQRRGFPPPPPPPPPSPRVFLDPSDIAEIEEAAERAQEEAARHLERMHASGEFERLFEQERARALEEIQRELERAR